MNRNNHIYNGEKCLKNYIHGIVDGIVLKGQEGEGGLSAVRMPPTGLIFVLVYTLLAYL